MRSTTVIVLVIGLAVTAGLAAAARRNYLRNESHLIHLQAELTASALSAAPVDIERRLGKAVGLAAVTGQASQFRNSIASSVGKRGPFLDAELYHVTDRGLLVDSALGRKPLLAPSSTRLRRLALHAERSGGLAVIRIVAPGVQRFAYAWASNGPRGTYAGYAEEALPANHQAAIAPDNPISGLNAAIYDGPPRADTLVLTDARHLPLTGLTAQVPIPFGGTVLTLVVNARHPLAGTLSQWLPWIIVLVGVGLSGVGAALVERLQRRRVAAEALTVQVDELYRAQRRVAETLQESLLPTRLAQPAGFQVSVRYLAGTAGLEVGGDWYDLFRLDGHRAFFSVGDVSGRGLRSAVLMSTLRNAINAYARDGNEPEAVLEKLDPLVDIAADGLFATIVCGLLDAKLGTLTLCIAGHPPPLLVTSDRCAPVDLPVGPPVGVGGPRPASSIELPVGSTLVAYTDGLIERRGEPLSTGIAQVCAAAAAGGGLDSLLDRVIHAAVPNGPSDDIALLALRRTL